MELSRRDLLAALTATGVASAGAAGTATLLDREGDATLGDSAVETMVAVADVVYPTAVEGIPAFVEQYSLARVRDRPDYADGVEAAIVTLDEYSRAWMDDDFRALSSTDRDAVLDQMGVDAADSNPGGSDAERVRYYLVNDLLYALYTTPTGGKLAGLENPPGHPGGLGSYQRGPEGSGRSDHDESGTGGRNS